jgi:hypothetical protein
MIITTLGTYDPLARAQGIFRMPPGPGRTTCIASPCPTGCNRPGIATGQHLLAELVPVMQGLPKAPSAALAAKFCIGGLIALALGDGVFPPRAPRPPQDLPGRNLPRVMQAKRGGRLV